MIPILLSLTLRNVILHKYTFGINVCVGEATENKALLAIGFSVVSVSCL